MTDDRLASWLAALDRRHLETLTPSEVARALRALSSCYVERRGKLAKGGALDSAGKRAAFALFYAPLHFLVTREIVRTLPGTAGNLTAIVDLGCGTGAAGVAWALESGAAKVTGIDRHPWAVAEANWTYRQLSISGRATRGEATTYAWRGTPNLGVIAAYTINELEDDQRDTLLSRMLDAHKHGARVLIVEPIARRMLGWWPRWQRAITEAGGRSDEWRFAPDLPDRPRLMAKAAGLDLRELTARSLWLPPRRPHG